MRTLFCVIRPWERSSAFCAVVCIAKKNFEVFSCNQSSTYIADLAEHCVSLEEATNVFRSH